MKVLVKVYGTLHDLFPDYDMKKGLTVALPEGSTFENLFRHLDIPDSTGCFAISNGQVMKKNDKIKEHFEIRIMQPLHGG